MTEIELRKIAPQDSKLWDIAAAIPLITLCLFGIVGDGIEIHREWLPARSAADYVLIASQVSGAIFLALQICLLCIRRLPVAKSPGLAPRIWALIGANSSYVIVLLPKTAQGPLITTLSSLMICAGMLASIFVLAWLGRGFAIFPQARILVTGGPYRLVRHPLYLCEQLSLFGVCLQYLQPWAFLIVSAGFGLQFPRMRYEEDILAQTFSPYAEYAARTPKIIPRIL